MIFADGITITTLVENYVDMLIPNTERIKRPGLAFHFDPRNKPIQAETGFPCWSIFPSPVKITGSFSMPD